MVKKWYPSSQINFQKIIRSAISFKISLKKSVWINQFDRTKMSLLCFYVTIVFLWCIWHQSVRKNVNKYLCRILSFYRCSYRRHSAKQVFLKFFAIFTGKHLCWSLFAGIQACNFNKKRQQHWCFPVNTGSFNNTYFAENL